jgi:hypothetical protein
MRIDVNVISADPRVQKSIIQNLHGLSNGCLVSHSGGGGGFQIILDNLQSRINPTNAITQYR